VVIVGAGLVTQNGGRGLRGEEAIRCVDRDRSARATLGRNGAGAHVFGPSLSGHLAWWAWPGAHPVPGGLSQLRLGLVGLGTDPFIDDRGLRAMIGPRSAVAEIR